MTEKQKECKHAYHIPSFKWTSLKGVPTIGSHCAICGHWSVAAI